jgi:succinate dehydrogenase / fumarate reductase membrane anchor subunit
LIQRISAVYLAMFVIYIGAVLAWSKEVTFQQWHEWLFHPFNTIACGLFVIALLLHAWVGMRDVVLDYVHNTFVRMIALSLIMIVLMGSGLWAAKILLLTVAS